MEKQEQLLEQKVLAEKETKVKIRPCKNTPFSIAKKDNKIYILIGNNVMSSKTFKSFKEAERYIYLKPYEIITNLVVLIYQHLKQENNE